MDPGTYINICPTGNKVSKRFAVPKLQSNGTTITGPKWILQTDFFRRTKVFKGFKNTDNLQVF